MGEAPKTITPGWRLREGRAKSRALTVAVECTDNAILITDREARIEWANGGFERLSGYSLAEIEGRKANELLHGPYTDATDAARLLAARQAGRPVVTEILNYHKDGHPYWVEVDVQPVTVNEGEEPERFVSVQRDVTSRKYGDALGAARATALAELAADADLSTVLTRLADSLAAVTMEMYLSVMLLDDSGRRLHPVAGPGLPRPYLAMLDGMVIGEGVGSCGTAAYRRERVISPDILEDPLWRPYRHLAELSGMRACWSEPIRGLDGQVLGTFAVYYPMPRTPSTAETTFIEQAAEVAGMAIERKRFETRLAKHEAALTAARDRAEMASRAKSRLLADLSEECRPFLDAMVSEEAAGDHRRRAAQLRGMLTDVRILTEAEAETADLAEAPVAVAPVIEAAMAEIEEIMDSAGAAIRTRLPSDLPDLYADAGALHRICVHVLRNAVQYGGEAASVTIEAGETGDRGLALSVADTGPGIANPEISRGLAALEAGGPIVPHLVRSEGTVGLGLAVSQTLMVRHDGRLDLDSTSGRGTRVTLTFPAERVVRNHAL